MFLPCKASQCWHEAVRNAFMLGLPSYHPFLSSFVKYRDPYFLPSCFRVPLSSNDDDDDDDKEKTPRDNGVTSRLSPDAASSVSVRQSVPAQCNVDLVLLKESNWSMCGPDDTERISSRVSVPPKGERLF